MCPRCRGPWAGTGHWPGSSTLRRAALTLAKVFYCPGGHVRPPSTSPHTPSHPFAQHSPAATRSVLRGADPHHLKQAPGPIASSPSVSLIRPQPRGGLQPPC